MYTKFILSGKNPGKIAGNCDKQFFSDVIILCPCYIYIFIEFKFVYLFTSRKQKTEKFLSKLLLINNYFFWVKSFYFLGNFSVFPLLFPYYLLIIYLLFSYYLFIFLLQNIKKTKKIFGRGGGYLCLIQTHILSLSLSLYFSISSSFS